MCGTTMNPTARLVSAQEVRDATVKLGWFRRERVMVYGYDDGKYVVGYPLRVGNTFIVVPLATVPFNA
jgi:cobalamin biosynthesis Mg chelatase CobN